MDFKQFLKLANEAQSVSLNEMDSEGYKGHREDGDPYAKGAKATPAKAKDVAKKGAEELDKAMDKAHEKKKSLKDWFEKVETSKLLSEADQLTIEPAKQSTQVIKKGSEVIGSVSNPALASTIKAAIGKGEMSLAGQEMKEAELDEKWAGDAKINPTGQYSGKSVEELKSMLAKLKKSGPHKEGTPGFKKMRQIMFAIRAKKDWKGGVDESEHVAEKSVSKAQQKFMGMVHAAQKGEKPASKDVADVAKSMKKGDVKDFAQTKHKGLPEKKKKTDEAEIPKSGSDFGAGLGAGRSDKVLEAKPDFIDLDKDGNKKESMKKAVADKKKKKVDEAMNTLEAAYHEGKSHGLTKHGYACRYNEGTDEHRRYHEGFKEGLDECYGLMPNRGLVVSEVGSGQDVVDDMASYGAEEGSMAEMDMGVGEGNAFTAALAKADKGEKFSVGGKTFTDRSSYDAKLDEFTFESLDKQLDELLNEGLSVNMSQGLGGPGGAQEDTVSVTAQGDDAGKLLAFIKQVGLGGLGGDQQLDGPAEPAAAMSDYGAPKFSGYDDKGGMMGLLKVMSGGEDYKDEEGHDHDHGHAEEATCNECGMAESKCGCDEGEEPVMDETQTPDQMTDEVAEDDGEGNIEADEQGAQIDAALAVGSENEKEVHEDGMESSPEAAGAVAAADASEEEESAMSEAKSSFLNLYKKLAWLAEESTAKEDEKAEKAGEKVTKDIEHDDKEDKKEKVDEWANDAGKDGTQQTFERDIEFMTKVISGGLNKPKSTGQTTIPVIAGQTDRMGTPKKEINESVRDWIKLAGLRQ